MAETTTKTPNKLVAAVKGIPSKVSKDVKASSKTTKVVAGVVTGAVAVGSFFIGRATKKAPKAKVAPATKEDKLHDYLNKRRWVFPPSFLFIFYYIL